MSKLNLVLLFVSFRLCWGYKLLLVFPFPGPNSVLGESYAKNLLNAGHEVTYITPNPMKNDTKGFRQVVLTNITQMYSDDVTNLEMQGIGTAYDMLLKITNATVMHKNIQNLLHDTKEQFDAVIVEWPGNEVYAGFSSVYNCPLIWASSGEPNAFVLMLLNEQPNAFTPALSTPNQPLTFWQRVIEQFLYLHIKFHRWLLSDKEASVFKRAFGAAIAKRGGRLPPFELVKHNGSLMFGNSHFSTGQKFRSPLNYIEIAGFHIDDKRESLSKNLQNVMDSSKNGVIYFSMRENYKISDDVKKSLLDVFKTINRTFIWQDKYQSTGNITKNVHVFKNLKYQSILGHPNCVLFITNGNLLSNIEAIHYGVPVIAIPKSRHQIYSTETAVNIGYGKKVKFLDIAGLKVAIEDVLRNRKYKEKVKEISLLYHDRITSPGHEIVFWVEHVIRTKGGLHLRSPSLDDFANLELVFLFSIPVTILFLLILCLIKRSRKCKDDVTFKKLL